ncbi:hypothetical protein KHA80_00920 [Anaerobacillus sp. HL2]|nr:hypothetical protein KHA80_00920 [Anaerobacillus sp. HL2]
MTSMTKRKSNPRKEGKNKHGAHVSSLGNSPDQEFAREPYVEAGQAGKQENDKRPKKMTLSSFLGFCWNYYIYW